VAATVKPQGLGPDCGHRPLDPEERCPASHRLAAHQHGRATCRGLRYTIVSPLILLLNAGCRRGITLDITRLYHKTRGLQLFTPGAHFHVAGPGSRDMKDRKVLRCIEYSGRGNANTA